MTLSEGGSYRFKVDLDSVFKLGATRDVDAFVTLAQLRVFHRCPECENKTFKENVVANEYMDWVSRSDVERIAHASPGGIYGAHGVYSFSEDELPPAEGQSSNCLGTKLCHRTAL